MNVFIAFDQTWTTTPPVHRRLSGLPQCCSWWGSDNTVARPSRCVADISHWLSASRLRLYPTKTVLIWLGSRQLVDKIGDRDVSIYSRRQLQPLTLRVTLEWCSTVVSPRLTAFVCRSAYRLLPPSELRTIVRSLSLDAAKTVVHAFISSRLDYCNSLASPTAYSGVYNLHRTLLHARVTGTRRRDHISLVLQQLHWLPVRQLVGFKLAVLVYKVSATRHHNTLQTIASF